MCTSAIQRALLTKLALACAGFLALTSTSVWAQSFEKGLGGLGKSPLGSQGPVDPLSVSAKLNRKALVAGDQAVIAVVLDFAPHWHAWPSASQDVLPPDVADFAIRTEITLVEKPDWLSQIGPVQWPDPSPAPVPDLMNPGQTIEVPVYQGRAIAFLPVVLSESIVPGDSELTVNVWYQACDEVKCNIPESLEAVASVQLLATIDEAAPINDGSTDPDFSAFDPTIFARMASGEIEGIEATPTSSDNQSASNGSTFFGYSIPKAEGALGVVLVALLSALGGFILNLTPCVLPVIPIKIMTISHHAGSPRRSLILGLWMAAGVVAFWVGIGLPVAFLNSVTDPSMLFGIWWVTLGIGVLIAAMGVGIMGLFTINLPQSVHKVNPKADTPGGSFLFGVMTAVLGLPCFGFVAGALLAGSATMPVGVILTIFTGLGVGMAAPYLVLAAKPSLLQKMPRTGPASDLVKQVMGLMLLAAAAFFVGAGAIGWLSEHPSVATSLPWWGKVSHWWVVALLAVAAGVWLAWRTFRLTKSAGRRGVFAVMGLAIGGAATAWAADATMKARNDIWVPFDGEALAQVTGSGGVAVIDFTAEWCLNCKALKATVLNRSPVKDELLKLDVTPLSADLTSAKAPGWEKLRELGQTGIPLLVIYGPGLDEPWQSNAYTPDQVMRALARARGEAPLTQRASSGGR